MSYSIFRVQGIKTLSDLRGIGKHNADRVSDTNLDIDREKSSENIELVKCDSYLKRFSEITLDMRREHEERMKTTRSDRRKSFEQAINGAKNDVACEFLFTSDEEFFKGKSKAEIQSWAQDSLEFVMDEIGLSHDRIIHASVHMDEKTPHLHIVAVPLTEIYDGRRKEDVLTISRHQFIKTKDDLSSLQDKYNERMNERGYVLERGTPKEVRHQKVQTFKEQTHYHEQAAVKAQQSVKELEGKKTNLELAISNRKSEMDDLKKEVTQVKKIDDMDFKEKGSLFNLKQPKSVELSFEDFQSLKSLAKSSEALKRENEAYKEMYEKEKIATESLRERNNSLDKQLTESKKETRWYKNQYERLGQLFDNIKDRYQSRAPEIFEDFQRVVGFAKYEFNRTVNRFKNNKQAYDENKLTKAEKAGYESAEKFFKDKGREKTRNKTIEFERD
ncbi:MobV family relaxase [Priestia megaterium]|uniref:MobV family relaxase n=1 Tax=Priestia megaterium TaxID=1404 RepID=UPI001C487C2B|nr:MobV family relaxase [Priestia megaterium]MBV6738850.1 plasmid recombination protein [Priestia megaterium]